VRLFFFKADDLHGIRSNQWLLGHPAALTPSRLGDKTNPCSPLDRSCGWNDAPSADSSLHSSRVNAGGLVDNWSRHSFTNHRSDPSTATVPPGSRRATKHKPTLVSCNAERCEQTFLRKDHLTQHIRNKHQDNDTKFRCPIYGCTDHSFSLLQLFEHMQQCGHKRDVHFTPIKNAVEKPKCSCGDGLLISGRCKACDPHLA
jgi:hypothetical protein